MLAPQKPTAAAIEGQQHTFECPDCEGSGRYIYVFAGGQEERDRGPCESCDGTGKQTWPVSAEDCVCDSCLSGFWFWPAPVGDRPAKRFEDLDHALRAGSGEVTRRDHKGRHSRIAMTL
jgi:hypothetical protein